MCCCGGGAARPFRCGPGACFELKGFCFYLPASAAAAVDSAEAPLYLPYKALVSTISSMMFSEGEAHRLIEILSEKVGIIQDTWHRVRPAPIGRGGLQLEDWGSLPVCVSGQSERRSGGCVEEAAGGERQTAVSGAGGCFCCQEPSERTHQGRTLVTFVPVLYKNVEVGACQSLLFGLILLYNSSQTFNFSSNCGRSFSQNTEDEAKESLSVLHSKKF